MNKDREVICPWCGVPVTVTEGGQTACWNCTTTLVT